MSRELTTFWASPKLLASAAEILDLTADDACRIAEELKARRKSPRLPAAP
jgi:hypothetical protein